MNLFQRDGIFSLVLTMNNKASNIFLIFLLVSIAVNSSLKPAVNKTKGNDKEKITEVNTGNIRLHKKNKNDSLENKGKEIIADYISAIGGKKRLSRIMDRTTYITGKVNNMNIHIVVYQKVPDMYLQKIELGAAEQKIVFDGVRGVMITGDNIEEMKGPELNKLKYEATMQFLLYLNAYDVKAEYNGIEKANGVDAYKVMLIFPGDMKWTEYYDTATYLKVKEIKPINSPDGKIINQESYFSNYQEVNGIEYPFTIKQFLGPSKFEFHVDSIKVNNGLSNRNFEIE